jgi:hypothetical protein
MTDDLYRTCPRCKRLEHKDERRCRSCGHVFEVEYRCSAGEKCLHGGVLMDFPGRGMFGQNDPYGIYAGKWHDDCWDRFGYGNFVFDPADAGERLEEDD